MLKLGKGEKRCEKGEDRNRAPNEVVGCAHPVSQTLEVNLVIAQATEFSLPMILPCLVLDGSDTHENLIERSDAPVASKGPTTVHVEGDACEGFVEGDRAEVERDPAEGGGSQEGVKERGPDDEINDRDGDPRGVLADVGDP